MSSSGPGTHKRRNGHFHTNFGGVDFGAMPAANVRNRGIPRYLQVAFILAIVFSALFFGRQADAARETIRLTVGQSRRINIRGTITKVQVLNPSVADVANHTTKTITVVGVEGGATEILVSTGRGKIKYIVTVLRVEVGRLYRKVRAFLGRIENIFPRLVGSSIVISGAALTPEDYGKVQRAVQLFGNKVLNLVGFRQSAVDQITEIFNQSGLTSIRARLVGGKVFLEGAVGSKADMEKVNAILRAYSLNVENLIKIGGGKQILIDVHFVEMRTRSLQNIGVQWPAKLGVGSGDNGLGRLGATIPIRPSGPSRVSLTMSGQIASASAALNLLFETGNARLLAQPRLVCGSGKSAEFVVGGELPVITPNGNNLNSLNVTYKEYGIVLKVSPTADSLGNVSSSIHAEVSEPDTSVAVRDVIGLRTRRFNTSVTVKEGSSIVLSGLFTNSEGKNVSKFPILGQLPILGELFKSRQFQQNKTTLVVFVTPRVVSPKHPWVRRSIRDIKRLYKDYQGEIGWQLFD